MHTHTQARTTHTHAQHTHTHTCTHTHKHAQHTHTSTHNTHTRNTHTHARTTHTHKHAQHTHTTHTCTEHDTLTIWQQLKCFNERQQSTINWHRNMSTGEQRSRKWFLWLLWNGIIMNKVVMCISTINHTRNCYIIKIVVYYQWLDLQICHIMFSMNIWTLGPMHRWRSEGQSPCPPTVCPTSTNHKLCL